MPIEVNFPDQKIYITSPTVAVTVQELINAIREAEETDLGISYAKIADASGKEELGEGVTVGITLNLYSPWQVEFWWGTYSATISGGNLVGGLGGDPIAYSAGVNVTLIISASSTIVTEGGAIPTPEEIAEAVWDALVSSHTATGSFGELLDILRSTELGRWKMIANQLIFYKPDNTTEVARFNLYDSDGNPSMADVFDRQRV